MRSQFLEQGLSTSQEELLAPPHSRNSLSSSIFGMSSKEPDLERADGASKTPQIQLGTSSSTPKGADGTKRRASKQRPQSTNRRHSQQRPLSRLAPPHHDPNAVPPKLVKLRTVIGISTPDSLLALSSSDLKQRPGANLGIYARIIKQEQIARYEFYFAASLINTCYAGQIVVAAALTALGASSSSHVVITVLGALNTVIAGMLTYLKGQGLPNRLRQYWNSLRKCREFIEEKERQCAAEGWGEDGQEGMDIDHEIDVIIKMYHDVRQTAEGTFPLLLARLTTMKKKKKKETDASQQQIIPPTPTSLCQAIRPPSSTNTSLREMIEKARALCHTQWTISLMSRLKTSTTMSIARMRTLRRRLRRVLARQMQPRSRDPRHNLLHQLRPLRRRLKRLLQPQVKPQLMERRPNQRRSSR